MVTSLSAWSLIDRYYINFEKRGCTNNVYHFKKSNKMVISRIAIIGGGPAGTAVAKYLSMPHSDPTWH